MQIIPISVVKLIDLLLFLDLFALFLLMGQDTENHSDKWYNSVPCRPTELLLLCLPHAPSSCS